MNIFVLDHNPILAAQYHCDTHVVKMILEGAQMLSTAVGEGYKPTHQNHPCTLWVKASRQNAKWLADLMAGLNREYRERYHHDVDHKSYTLIQSIEHLIDRLPDAGLTPYAQAMPEELRIPGEPVKAYRNYYRTKSFAAWNRSTPPLWWDYPELEGV